VPYLDAPWHVPPDKVVAPSFPREIASGVWVPEHDLLGWSERHINLPHSDVWVRRSESTEGGLEELRRLPSTVKEDYLDCLGRDIGSAHRDGFLYGNLLEQLKQGPLEDTAADALVDRMEAMRFTSALWTEPQGGPPLGESPRSWRRLGDWLLEQIGKLGEFLVSMIDPYLTLVADFARNPNNPLASISIGIPPQLGFEFAPADLADPAKWKVVIDFLKAIWKEEKTRIF
jgi:hypothetical protein